MMKEHTMKKVFWDNPYQADLVTHVASVEGNEILFEETIIYSFAGGQESDKAVINGLPVISSRMEENLIHYTLPDGHGLSKGDKVTMIIDWPRRYRLMRLHFAAELILEIVTQKFHLQKVGAHIAEHKARIDFISNENITPLFGEILSEYNKIIKENRSIQVDFSDVKNQRRFWKIDGFAQVPCGGTHVQSTAEVGFVTLKREHPGKSIERIEIRLIDTSTPNPTPQS